MKCLMLLVPLMLTCLTPVLTLYMPPTKGGPGSSRGSGTRILRPHVWEAIALPDVSVSKS